MLTYKFYQEYLDKSIVRGIKHKELSIVPNEELSKELDNIKDVLFAYEHINKDQEEIITKLKNIL